MAQYRAHQDMARRCELAPGFVIGKLSNQRTLLQRYNRRQSDAAMRQAIDQEAEDSVRFYPLCAQCLTRVETVGGRQPHEEFVFIV